MGMKVMIATFVILGGIQLISIDRTNPPVDKAQEIVVPPDVHAILRKGCYDCHSYETKWPWYSRIAPISWTIADHVEEGREALNFSEWNRYDQTKHEKLLKEIYREAYAAMPLSSYAAFHKEADLTPQERELVRAWTGVRADMLENHR